VVEVNDEDLVNNCPLLTLSSESVSCERSRSFSNTKRWKMQVVIYARISTLDQQQEGTTASQVRLLKQHIQQQNRGLLPEYEFLDEGISGARLDRPALDRLRDCAQRGEFDAFVYGLLR
jgi:hypothetical protein